MPNKNFSPKASFRLHFYRTFITFFIIILIVLFVFFFYIHNVNEHYKNQRETLITKASLVEEISDTLSDVFFRARGYYAFQNEQELAQVYTNMDKLDPLLAKFKKMVSTEEERVIYEQLIDFKAYYEKTFPSMVQHVKNNDYEALRNQSNAGMNDIVNDILNYAQKYKVQTDKNLNTIFHQTIAIEQRLMMLAIAIIVIVILLTITMLQRILNQLVKPIEQLTNATIAITKGKPFNLNDLLKKNNEIGVLSTSFQMMWSAIREKEEELVTQNEELLAQQTALEENQAQLQKSLYQLEKHNDLNEIVSFTMDKQILLDKVHKYINTIATFDGSFMYLLEEGIYTSVGISEQSIPIFIDQIDSATKYRLIHEKAFILSNNEQAPILDTSYNNYLYGSIVSPNGKIHALFVAICNKHFESETIGEIQNILSQISIAFDRIIVNEEKENVSQLNQNIIDNVNEGIQFVTNTGEIIQTNESLCQIVQRPNWLQYKTIEQSEWLSHFQIIAKNAEELTNFFKKSIKEQFTETRKIYYEITINNPTFIEVYATCVFQQERKIGTVFVHRDITKEFEMDRMKSELVSTVSHELRTPLSSILGFAELLLTKQLTEERKNKYITIIHKEANRLTTLVNDFLNLQRMEAGKQGYTKQSIDFNTLVHDVSERLDGEQTHPIDIHYSEEPLIVNVDVERMVQVLINLIGNAKKFSEQCSPIKLTIQREQQNLLFSIQDEGIGIPEKEIPLLFQKFKRVDNSYSRKVGGTGLGLAICQKIIDGHEGNIWIESEEHVGTTVYFTLPLIQTVNP